MPNIKAAIPVMYRAVDLNGVIQDCNEYYAERLGHTVEEAIGASILDHSTMKTSEELLNMLAVWREDPTTHISRKIQMKTKYGEVVNGLQIVRNRYDGDSVVGVDAIIRDVAAIKRIQDLYNIGARKGYEDPHILRRSVDYIGIIVDCSQSYLDNMGYTKDEVVGISLYEHTALRSRGSLHTNMENWRSGHSDEANIWMRRKDGSEFLTVLSTTDETDEDGAIIGRTVALRPVDKLNSFVPIF